MKETSGKTLNVHHNQLKLCTVPQDGTRPTCPVPKAGEVEIVYGPTGGDEIPGCTSHEVHNLQRFARPPKLRQNIRPPMRYGDFVSH